MLKVSLPLTPLFHFFFFLYVLMERIHLFCFVYYLLRTSLTRLLGISYSSKEGRDNLVSYPATEQMVAILNVFGRYKSTEFLLLYLVGLLCINKD